MSAESPVACALLSKKHWVPKKDEISSNVRSPWQFKPGNNHHTSSLGIHLQKKVAALQSFFEENKRSLTVQGMHTQPTRGSESGA